MTSALRNTRRLFLLCAAIALAGCRAPSSTNVATGSNGMPSGGGFPRTVTDVRGHRLTLLVPPRRIISLAPSNTEMIYALGLGDRLIADTISCDYPPEARSKPHVADIQGGVEDIEALSPDLVVAVAGINTVKVNALEKLNTPVIVLPVRSLQNVYDAMALLGRATGHDGQSEKLVAAVRQQMDAVRSAVAGATVQPKVLMLYSASPLFTTGPGSFIDDVIAIAGGRNVVASPLPRDTLSPEQVVAFQPDDIICDASEVERIKSIPGWRAGVPAVRNQRFYCIPDASLLARPGPRLAKAADSLARYLHPDRFTRSSATAAGGAHL